MWLGEYQTCLNIVSTPCNASLVPNRTIWVKVGSLFLGSACHIILTEDHSYGILISSSTVLLLFGLSFDICSALIAVLRSSSVTFCTIFKCEVLGLCGESLSETYAVIQAHNLMGKYGSRTTVVSKYTHTHIQIIGTVSTC